MYAYPGYGQPYGQPYGQTYGYPAPARYPTGYPGAFPGTLPHSTGYPVSYPAAVYNPYGQSRIQYGNRQPQFSYGVPAGYPAPQYGYQGQVPPQFFTSRINFQNPANPQVLTSPPRAGLFASPSRGPLTVQSQFISPQKPQQKPQIRPQDLYTGPHHALPVNEPFHHHKPTTKSQAPGPKAKDDDLEKRFADAIKRTKNIVDKYNPNANGEAGQDNSQNGSNNKDDPENPQDQEIEELALQYEDGYIYRGQGYPPQTRQGFGVLNDQENHEVYAGFWQDNFYHGEGRLNNLQQEQIDGPIDWNNMTAIGNGWAVYEGEFSQGKMHGQGILFLTNGEKFVGQFQDGMIHGDGEFSQKDGKVVKGTWNQGALVQLQD